MKGLTVRESPSLAELTNIRLGGKAIAEVLVESADGFETLGESLRRLGGKPVVLGRGSNIIAKDGELPLVLLRLGKDFQADGPELLEEDGKGTLFATPAGMPLPILVSRLTKGGYSGLEGLVGIPGSVGGAVAMNAGSFGMDIKGCLQSISLFLPELGLVKRKAEELELDYRHFSVPDLGKGGWYIVTGVELRCLRTERDKLLKDMAGFQQRKINTQPVQSFSAGCVFKNHAAGPAGKLLEEAGMKGKARGGMRFSDLHANFLVNTGKGRSDEAFELISEARDAVLARFGARLELEVILWP